MYRVNLSVRIQKLLIALNHTNDQTIFELLVLHIPLVWSVCIVPVRDAPVWLHCLICHTGINKWQFFVALEGDWGGGLITKVAVERSLPAIA